jgi:hypothetical protein
MSPLPDKAPETVNPTERSECQIDVRDPVSRRFLGVVISSDLLRRCRMSALAAIAVFPILTLLLIGLSKAENVFFDSAPRTADPVASDPPALGRIKNL